jgi:hypothetical protein
MKKTIILTIILTCFHYFHIYSQPIIEWEKKINYGREDILIDFERLTDGSFLGLGCTRLPNTVFTFECACYKFDCRGNIIWTKKIPERIYNNEPIRIDSLSSSRFVIYGGKVRDSIGGRFTGFITVIDSAGDIIQTKEFNGNGNVSITKVVLNDDQTYTLLINARASDGIFQNNRGETDIWLLKTDKAFNIISKKNIGGSSNDFGTAIIKLKDENYILVGGTTSRDGDIKGLYSGEDAFVMKLNSNFNVIWSTTFGGNDYESINDVIEMADRSLIVGGSSGSSDGAFKGQPTSGSYIDAFVARINSSGGLSWVKCLGVDRAKNPEYLIWPPLLVPIDSSNFLVNASGKTNEGLLNSRNPVSWLLKMNTLGENIWKKSYGNRTTFLPHKSNRIKILPDRSFLLVGTATDSTNFNPDFWLLKLSPLEPNKMDECGKLVLYPNPTAKDLKIKTAEYFLPNASVKVVDVLGRNIFSGVVGKNCQEFNVELPNSLSTGMYFLKIDDIKKCVLPFIKAE